MACFMCVLISGCQKTEIEQDKDGKIETIGETGQMSETKGTEQPATEQSEIVEEAEEMEKYYGCYRVTQFYDTIYYSARKYDVMPNQEADMLIGRVVAIKPDTLVTYDTERARGTRGGRNGFEGNYMIEKQVLENPDYEWLDITTIDDNFLWPDSDMQGASDMSGAIGTEYYNQVTGVICIPDLCEPFGSQYYYTLEDPNKLIMFSTLTFQYFLLERCEDEDRKELEEVSQEEQRDILENCYGNYQVVEFLPTKFWPALDCSLNVILPKEEADMMIGKTIILSEKLFHTYDNFRQPNSEFVGRLEDGYWLKDVDIINPEYQIKKVRYEDIYGIRDGMLAKELTQEEYIEIDVFPGYKANGINNLPQLYLVDDGRIIMYSMGEYFLLEKI